MDTVNCAVFDVEVKTGATAPPLTAAADGGGPGPLGALDLAAVAGTDPAAGGGCVARVPPAPYVDIAMAIAVSDRRI